MNLDEHSEPTDKEMLDWLISQGAYLVRSRDGDLFWLVWPYGREGDGEKEIQEGSFYTSREAIMDAMKATP